MTAYVRGVPDPGGAWYLWADDPDEAMTAAAFAGANVISAHRPARAEGHYDLTVEEWAHAVSQGAQIRPLADAWINAQTRAGRKDLLTPKALDAFEGIP